MMIHDRPWHSRRIRKEHESRIEALFTDTQKKQWKEMLGKPSALDD
jgi:hypothetical protein